jgi:hypothetical protein
MQSWQLLSFGLVAAVVVVGFSMSKRLRGRAAEAFGGALQTFQTEVAADARPGESAPLLVMATERKMLSAKLFWVAITNRRVVWKLAGGDTRSFDRQSVQLAIKKKTFADVGNMQTTYSSGWELKVVLPDGGKHTCRVYEHAEGIPDHPAHVHALVAQLGAA